MIDLAPAAEALAALLPQVRDDQLTIPTPCTEWDLGSLIDHINGFALAFGAAGRKDLGPVTAGAPEPDGTRLHGDWRTEISEAVVALGQTWHDPAAWTGDTQVGGVDLPGAAAGLFALNELVVHGWDLAVATGQDFEVDPVTWQACWEFAQQTTGPGFPFGPPVAVPDDAPQLDRLIGLRGRRPAWSGQH